MVLLGDLLRAQMFFDRQRIVRSALHRRVVGDDHAVDARNFSYAGDDARARRRAVVKAVGGELSDFEKGRAGIKQQVDALARQKLSA